ncbi:MAG: hypothetical protein KKB65_01390 [Nanoarchaeota archaeon]|nr:hypothetical protein [Nanoarchaeota archaeon]MBU1029863.1 hypothetical protein [Nanoarchaeota archaeon]MBU1849287.1 hypothetical protein [Nanoarchaeota archaeon]
MKKKGQNVGMGTIIGLVLVVFLVYLSVNLLGKGVINVGKTDNCDLKNGICKNSCSATEIKWETQDCKAKDQICCISKTGEPTKNPADNLKVLLMGEYGQRLYEYNTLKLRIPASGSSNKYPYTIQVYPMTNLDDISYCSIAIFRTKNNMNVYLRKNPEQTPLDDKFKPTIANPESEDSFYIGGDCEYTEPQHGLTFTFNTESWWGEIEKTQGPFTLFVRGYDDKNEEKGRITINIALEQDIILEIEGTGEEEIITPTGIVLCQKIKDKTVCDDEISCTYSDENNLCIDCRIEDACSYLGFEPSCTYAKRCGLDCTWDFGRNKCIGCDNINLLNLITNKNSCEALKENCEFNTLWDKDQKNGGQCFKCSELVETKCKGLKESACKDAITDCEQYDSNPLSICYWDENNKNWLSFSNPVCKISFCGNNEKEYYEECENYNDCVELKSDKIISPNQDWACDNCHCELKTKPV